MKIQTAGELANELAALQVTDITVPSVDWLWQWMQANLADPSATAAADGVSFTRSTEYQQRARAAALDQRSSTSAAEVTLTYRGQPWGVLYCGLEDGRLRWSPDRADLASRMTECAIRVDVGELRDPLSGSLNLGAVRGGFPPDLAFALATWLREEHTPTRLVELVERLES